MTGVGKGCVVYKKYRVNKAHILTLRGNYWMLSCLLLVNVYLVIRKLLHLI